MVRLLLPFATFASLLPLVSAGIKFKTPAASAKLTAGTSISVEWEEGGTGPTIANLLTYQLFLCAGGDTADVQVTYPITTAGNFAVGGNKASVLIPKTVGEDTDNAYFVKMIAVGKLGGELTTYSDRFSYSGMTGTWTSAVETALKDVSGTSGPATTDNTVSSDDNTVSSAVADSNFDVEYTMQTGATRYAPMQPVPPKTVTAKNTKPLYPTSSVVIAKTRLPIPSVQTTVTMSQTASFSSKVNDASAASHATDDMAKFLARWKD
ncbi:beta-1,6-glucan boisynthesis protein-like protein [Dothidotthia symphoricarpi CBS 119687]|uniref:Beta-1,6-glucan boisynthesis protein-like protein n=1 Tax=Dothidotthia symphoricarpi CBS 119687 TaxID=1392245 RepID=A0A6A5ZZV9_9PLEO|nr:beta-1,6-glucan boisynthesis protein-like protein [Dothidotthia symphoricarpi CBS 119687]KAF2125109.1 beta-1,6-glucan boisynthesis protein-like protein [Dothidotthia symphoricarpi CBS 119687]